MTNHSLFGELAVRLDLHPENVATQALEFILTAHPAAWPAFRNFLAQTTVNLPDRLTFRGQERGDDSAIPDLVGIDRDGRQVLVIEAKFWASLTENQPVVYLQRLPSDRDGALLVIAPTARLGSLWHKLLSRCRDAGVALTERESPPAEFKLASLRAGQVLALTSWRALLSSMTRDAEVRGASALAVDLTQLNGLCARMDTVGFLPLRASELAPEIGRRVQQFADLVDHVVLEQLVPNHGASVKNLSTGGGKSAYGRFFLMKGLGCFFCFSPSLWGQHGRPMWQSVKEADWSQTQRIRDLLDQYAADIGSVVADDTRGGPCVPIELPTGREKADVVATVVQQIAGILGKISTKVGSG
jgi:hypothetical protein